MPVESAPQVKAPTPLSRPGEWTIPTLIRKRSRPRCLHRGMMLGRSTLTVATALVQAASNIRKDEEAMADVKYNLEERIALTRRNIAELTERAAVANGAAAEERLANLLSDQQDLLNCLLEQRGMRTSLDTKRAEPA